MSDRAKDFAKRSARTVLLVLLVWLRPVVRVPLWFLSWGSLLALVMTTLIADASDLRGKAMMLTAGVGARLVMWLYDFIVALLAGDDETLLVES